MAKASRQAYPLALALTVGVLLLTTVAGVAWAETIRCVANNRWCEGTKNDDIMYGTSSWDYLAGRDGNDTLKGADEVDWLYGNRGRDKLFGQSGGDEIVGGPGDDELNGGSGDDWYPKYNDGSWGHDTLTDATGIDEVFFDDGWTSADVTINLNARAKPNVRNENRTGTIDWDGEVIENAYGGDGNDTIIGNDADNVLGGGWNGGREADFDTISGRGGDDTIQAAGNAVVDCGDGDDTLIALSYKGEVPQNVNCETVTPVE